MNTEKPQSIILLEYNQILELKNELAEKFNETTKLLGDPEIPTNGMSIVISLIAKIDFAFYHIREQPVFWLANITNCQNQQVYTEIFQTIQNKTK